MLTDMTAYLLIRVAVTDWDRYREYMALTPAALAKYQGRFIARGGESVTLEGPQETRRLVIDVVSWYWHFMGLLWLYIFGLLYFAR